MRHCEKCLEVGFNAGAPVDICRLCGGPVIEGPFAINHDQRLFVIPAGHGGYSCLGFDVCDRWRTGVVEWLRKEGAFPGWDTAEVEFMTAEHHNGSPAAYRAYEAAMKAGAAFNAKTGKRCPVELTPALEGLEGRRVEVTGPNNYKRRFWVSKSMGWCPCHLEISTRNSRGGSAVYIPKGGRVRVVSSERR